MKKGNLLISFFLVLTFFHGAQAQTSDVTYQGRLESGGQPANASYDFEFKLYDAPGSGNPLETRKSRLFSSTPSINSRNKLTSSET